MNDEKIISGKNMRHLTGYNNYIYSRTMFCYRKNQISPREIFWEIFGGKDITRYSKPPTPINVY